MELLENKRVASRYSESIRSLHKHSPIELGKKITSPKKRKSKKKSPLKVIKISGNVNKSPVAPNFLNSNNNTTDYKNHQSQKTKMAPIKYSASPPIINNRHIVRPVNRTGNELPRYTSLPSYPPKYDSVYKPSYPPNNIDKYPKQHRSHANNTGGFINNNSNINYQYIPQIQTKNIANTQEPKKVPYNSENITFSSSNKVIKDEILVKNLKPLKLIKPIKPKKQRPVYQKKRLYIKTHKKNTPNKNSETSASEKK